MESLLVSLIEPIVGGRVYPDFAPAGTAVPFATYQQVGGRSVPTLDGASALRNARIQINVWAGSRAEAMTLSRQIESVLLGSPLRAVSQGAAVAEYDEAADMRGARQDFSIWYA